jgi:hypothetical protein
VVSRSGDACAYPTCGAALTFDALSAGDQPKAVGKVAHIAAASPGGPRYDPDMSDSQRSSADNLIYLCGTHHDAIDFQLEHHTREFLSEAKRAHEATVARAVRAAIGHVTFAELSVVCAVLASAPPAFPVDPVELPLALQDKIELNQLGETATERIRTGLSQSDRVAEFVEFQNRTNAAFGAALVARFRAEYYLGLADGLSPDEVFDLITSAAFENAAVVETPTVQAAALAVVAFLFELCEIFERG